MPGTWVSRRRALLRLAYCALRSAGERAFTKLVTEPQRFAPDPMRFARREQSAVSR
jgi:hypothetical protein